MGGLQNTVDTLTAKFASIIDIVYPVGSIYMSVNAADPAKLFSGTAWEKLEGRFLLGSSSTYANGATGGEATHALTANEMPEHRHSIAYPNGGGPYGDAAICYPEGSDTEKTWLAEMCKTQSAGGSAAHNNMPPYLVVNMWKRIS